jgi:hypothetical protein
MSQLEVDKVIPQSGTTLTLGESGDTVSIPSGATFTPTLTAPIIDEINDNNGNEEIIFTTTTSAVNELTIANAATGNAPEIAATGDDTDIDLKLTPKGAGNLVLDGIEFPNADGSANQVLQTNGSGVLSFATPSGGKVLQVVQTVKTDTFTTTATTATDITGFSASITPSSASNKILVLVNLMSSSGTGMITGSHLLLRGSTIIAGGDAAGNRATGFCSTGPWDGNWQGINGNAIFLDSPNTTSSTTYKIQVIKEASTYYLNRTGRDTDDAWHCRSASTILLLEIAG